MSEPNAAQGTIGPFTDDVDTDVWDEVAAQIGLDRRLDALGMKLLEATERLLDPEAFGTTPETARGEARGLVRTIREGYEDKQEGEV